MNRVPRQRPTVTVLVGNEPPRELERLESRGSVRIADHRSLEKCLLGSDVLYLWDFFSTSLRHAWSSADQLKWMHVAAVGVDTMLFPELVHSDVEITNAHGVFDVPIAEFVLGCVIRHIRQLDAIARDQTQYRWAPRVTRNVAGTSALIVGIGGIGRATGRLLKSVGMRVEGAGRTARAGDSDFEAIHSAADLKDIISRFDVVVLALPLTNGTRRLIDRSVIEAMNSRTYVVNVGRGGVVDQEFLEKSLATGAIAGAALDTFECEPLPESNQLWALNSVFVSPHTSSRTEGWLKRLNDQFIDKLDLWLTGSPLPGAIDKNMYFLTDVSENG